MHADVLLAEIETFCERVGMTVTRFGVEAVRDPSFVGRLRAGRSPTLRTVEKVRAFINSYK